MGSKAILTRMPGSREWLTIVVCVSASGDNILSQYIFTGKEFCGNYVLKCEPDAIMNFDNYKFKKNFDFVNKDEACVLFSKYKLKNI